MNEMAKNIRKSVGKQDAKGSKSQWFDDNLEFAKELSEDAKHAVAENPSVVKFRELLLNSIIADQAETRSFKQTDSESSLRIPAMNRKIESPPLTPNTSNLQFDLLLKNGAEETSSSYPKSGCSIHTEDSGEQQDASSDIDDYVLIDAEALNGSQKANTVLAYVQIIYASLFAWVLGVIEDFSDGPTDPYPNALNKKSQGLSVNRLHKNVKRTIDNAMPAFETAAGIWDILLWKQPLYSILMFMIFMHGVYTGRLLCYVLGVIILQLSLNFLVYYKRLSGFKINLIPKRSIDQEYLQEISGQGDQGVKLMMFIAHQVQLLLEIVADLLEKFKNLLIWKSPRITALFYAFLWFWFFLSIVLDSSVFWIIIGFGVGIKLFVLIYFYHRFPKLRRRFDIVFWFTHRLPTDKTVNNNEANKKAILEARESLDVKEVSRGMSKIGLVMLPEGMEQAQPKSERHCLLVDKERSFLSTVSSGTLAITDNSLIFRFRRKTEGRHELLRIVYADILYAAKVHASAVNWVPGSGMGLEINVVGRAKPYLFAALPKRDEFYTKLVESAKEVNANFATND